MFTKWNYRVVHTTLRHANGELEDRYAIHEIYYTDDEPTSMTEDPVNPQGETPEELKEDINRFLKATALQILEANYFEQPRDKS